MLYVLQSLRVVIILKQHLFAFHNRHTIFRTINLQIMAKWTREGNTDGYGSYAYTDIDFVFLSYSSND